MKFTAILVIALFASLIEAVLPPKTPAKAAKAAKARRPRKRNTTRVQRNTRGWDARVHVTRGVTLGVRDCRNPWGSTKYGACIVFENWKRKEVPCGDYSVRLTIPLITVFGMGDMQNALRGCSFA
ncbi:hypothetical protein VFPPC_05702 [Pochonia chlamydosporia 170]|uniref:Uncharacterized protein n=1 Tax=Pochonia chlamydosporia 170 TaxID=1380566 RepID=A0A179FGF6_METCM|nr:hypothetical protein VFPPC_05702 [Pochonia chlamydosporia 170]OAQ64428.1 hypothetical protein VFPPC_05702 [Pochonia chlamydosporia 170]